MATLVRQTHRTKSSRRAALRRVSLGRGNRRHIGSRRASVGARSPGVDAGSSVANVSLSIFGDSVEGPSLQSAKRLFPLNRWEGVGSTAGRCRCGLTGACTKQFWKVSNGEYGLAAFPDSDRRRGANGARDSVLPSLRRGKSARCRPFHNR